MPPQEISGKIDPTRSSPTTSLTSGNTLLDGDGAPLSLIVVMLGCVVYLARMMMNNVRTMCTCNEEAYEQRMLIA